MILKVFNDKEALGEAAAAQAASYDSPGDYPSEGSARIIAATGASQFEFLELAYKAPDVDWEKVEMFHLDEYRRPASRAPGELSEVSDGTVDSKDGHRKYHLLDGEADPGR